MTSRPVVLLFVFLALLSTVYAECPDGAIEGITEGGTKACYLYERFPAQFVTAERLCRDSHGNLASINNLFTNDFIAQGGVEAFEVMQIDNFWVGGDDLEKQGQWKWISGDKFEFSNWAGKEPVKDKRSFCVALSLPQGLWYAKSCYESKPYVCELPASNVSSSLKHHKHKKTTPLRSTRHQQPTTRHQPATTQSTAQCAAGYSFLKSTGLCYKIVSDSSDCYRSNTQEASIHTKSENNFIGSLAQKLVRKNGEVNVRLSLAKYHPAKTDSLSKDASAVQAKPWLSHIYKGIPDLEQRREFFQHLRENKKNHGSSSSEEDEGGKANTWVWFDGSSVDFSHWAKNEPKKTKKDEFACAQLVVKKGKSNFEWTSTDCLKPEFAVCSQQPNRH